MGVIIGGQTGGAIVKIGTFTTPSQTGSGNKITIDLGGTPKALLFQWKPGSTNNQSTYEIPATFFIASPTVGTNYSFMATQFNPTNWGEARAEFKVTAEGFEVFAIGSSSTSRLVSYMAFL